MALAQRPKPELRVETDRQSRGMWLIALLYLMMHASLAVFLPARLAPLSTLCIVLAELSVAASAVWYARRFTSHSRVLWCLLACSSFLESVAMCLDMVTEIRDLPKFSYAPAMPVFFSMLYGVPLLAAVSISFDRRVSRVARTISVLQSIAIGVLVYFEIFDVFSLRAGGNSTNDVLIARLFDAIDLYLALAATIRWFGSESEDDRVFFGVASIFLWLNTFLPAFHNWLLLRHDYVWLDLFLSTPYVVLFVLIGSASRFRISRPARQVVRVVQSGSPLFQCTALLVIGVLTAHTHLYIGMAAALLGFCSYAVLNVLAQSRGQMSEEDLLASKTALEALVGMDPLTGIPNRWTFDEALMREWAMARRTRLPMSLLMIDVDHFKLFNDTQGHQAGDACLAKIAGTLRASLPRSTDLVARYGGEEFAVILPTTDREGAEAVAWRLCGAIGDLQCRHSASEFGIVTISIGYSSYEGSAALEPFLLTEAADRGLYNAKRLGRNRCEWFSMEGMG